MATGITLLLKRKARKPMNMMNISSGLIKRRNEMPEDFIATSSKFSPMLPNVIIDARRMLNGKASGTRVVDIYTSNWMIVQMFIPLPMSSSIYSQKNCITKTKRDIKKVTINGPTKLRMINMSSFFINRNMIFKIQTYIKTGAVVL